MYMEQYDMIKDDCQKQYTLLIKFLCNTTPPFPKKKKDPNETLNSIDLQTVLVFNCSYVDCQPRHVCRLLFWISRDIQNYHIY